MSQHQTLLLVAFAAVYVIWGVDLPRPSVRRAARWSATLGEAA